MYEPDVGPAVVAAPGQHLGVTLGCLFGNPQQARQMPDQRLPHVLDRQLAAAGKHLGAWCCAWLRRRSGTRGGRQPPSDTDCRVLAFGQIREAIVVTDDLGMHRLAGDFELPIWHGWELLAKMRSAKKVDNDLIREIYDALERNGDVTATWREAKHTEFVKVFGPKR